MANLNNTILLIGEGPTEFFYFNSVKSCLKGLSIEPGYPKHSNLKELASKIDNGVKNGYTHIFCVIDMDTKCQEPERTKYLNLKKKYSNPIIKPRLGINCEVRFYETHRCTELFFLYYFCYTSKSYINQTALINDLNRHCEYIKTREFFQNTKGLHSYFEKNGGSLEMAISNAEKSDKERHNSGRNFTYSELGRMFNDLKIIRNI